MGKWIRFLLSEQKPKTVVWRVETKEQPVKLLGLIKWYPAWRKYCFFPNFDTVYEEDCLKEIADFISEQTYAHKRRNTNLK